MTASELKAKIEAKGSNFFCRENMKFFGDTMKNYGVRQTQVETYSQGIVEVWELYRKHSVNGGLRSSAYFSKADFSHIVKKS